MTDGLVNGIYDGFYRNGAMGASTDLGDVSWQIPVAASPAPPRWWALLGIAGFILPPAAPGSVRARRVRQPRCLLLPDGICLPMRSFAPGQK